MRAKVYLKEARAYQSRLIKALNKCRREQRLTYRELGKLSGVNFATVYRTLSRKGELPSFVVIAAVSLALGLTAKRIERTK